MIQKLILKIKFGNWKGEPRSREFLLQRILVVVQTGNAAAVLGEMGRRLDGWE